MRSVSLRAALIAAFCCSVMAAEKPTKLRLHLEVMPAAYSVGTPITIRLRLENTGTVAEELSGWGRGWGDDIVIEAKPNGGAFHEVIDKYLPQIDAMGSGVYRAPYRFGGQLSAGESQYVVYLLPMEGWASKTITLRVRAGAYLPVLATEEVAVELAAPEKQEDRRLFTNDELSLIYGRVTRCHNARGALDIAGPEGKMIDQIFEKASKSQSKSIDCQYALYLAVQHVGRPDPQNRVKAQVTMEHLYLAQEAARLFLERFPGSYLRPHVHAELARIHYDLARLNLQLGRALPDAYPLFENLQLDEKLGLFPGEVYVTVKVEASELALKVGRPACVAPCVLRDDGRVSRSGSGSLDEQMRWAGYLEAGRRYVFLVTVRPFELSPANNPTQPHVATSNPIELKSGKSERVIIRVEKWRPMQFTDDGRMEFLDEKK